MDATTKAAWNSLSVAAASDALDRCGIEGQCLGILPLTSGFRLLGSAVTVRYGPHSGQAGTVGAYMRTGKDRVQVEACNVPVSLGEVRVEPGDLLFGDADGIVVIAQARPREVLDLALQIEARENQIRDAVASSLRLDEARRAAGFHQLQRRAQPKD